MRSGSRIKIIWQKTYIPEGEYALWTEFLSSDGLEWEARLLTAHPLSDGFCQVHGTWQRCWECPEECPGYRVLDRAAVAAVLERLGLDPALLDGKGETEIDLTRRKRKEGER